MVRASIFVLVTCGCGVLAASCASGGDVERPADGSTETGGASAGGAGGTGGQSAGTGGSSTGGSSADAGDAASGDGSTDGAPTDGAAGDGAVTTTVCPTGSFMTGLSGGGIACDTLDGAARASVNQSCAVYAGWNDYCSGCTADPSKWGYASGDACTNGAGVDDTCTQPTLGGNVVNLFGLSPDNNVDGADTFRTSLHCTAPAATTSSGAATCPTGQFVTAVTGGTVECATIADLAASYFGSQCTLYAGWRDGCNACTQDPVKWVGSNDADCSTSGTYTVCTQPALGTESVRLGGYGTEGDVDGNDSFYLGLRCTGAAASGGTQTGACPAGQFVTEVKPNGDVTCTGAATAIEAYVRSGCYVYAGWRDSCNGCTSDPTKWGRASDAACEVGANGSCLTSTLGTESVNLVVYDTDGDVNGDDKFYYGLKCY